MFTAASLASGLAPAAGALVAARAGQGLGAALLSPAALSIITSAYTGAQQATALGVWGALGGAGAAVGVLAGGVLTTWLGWRSVFLVNVPVGVAAFLLGLHLVSRDEPRRGLGRELDVPGAALATAGVVWSCLAPPASWSARSSVSARSGYLAGFLPGLLVVGTGTGLVLLTTAITAMNDIAEDRAGLAAGLMTTAHEIGAALGVAVFSAVAVATGGGIAAGYRHGFTVAAAVAGGLAVVTTLLVPAVRPAAGARVAVH